MTGLCWVVDVGMEHPAQFVNRGEVGSLGDVGGNQHMGEDIGEDGLAHLGGRE
jgi:hypothetical protein